MRELAVKFMALFDGAERGYGVYDVVGAKTPEGKRVGNAATKTGPVTVELWEGHLSGKTGIGIIPIKEDSTTAFGAIDIDVYDGLDHKQIARTLEKYTIPMVVTRSKSGGAHLWTFAKSPVPAATMKRRLTDVAAFLGFGKAEIFPIQSTILAERGDRGNWINCPYFNGMAGMRFAIRTDGEAMSPEEFLAYAEKIKVDEDSLNAPLQSKMAADFIDGPPCLQHLAQLGIPDGTRNNGLFAMAVYLRKAFPEAWEDMLEEYNVKYMSPPLKSSEVLGTIKSAKKREYAYPCSKPPIAQHCNSAVCRTRKFGIQGGSTGAFPNLGVLTKLDVRPPIWFWDVEGQRLELTTTELQDPNAFQRKCMDTINMMPAVPNKVAWNRIVQDAMEKVVTIEASEDASPEGQFWEYVQKFCGGRAKAQALDEIIQGKPFDENGLVHFRIVDLEAFLDRQRFREFKTNKICALLRDKGGKTQFSKLKGKGTNYWSLPMGDQQEEAFDVPKSLKKGEEVY